MCQTQETLPPPPELPSHTLAVAVVVVVAVAVVVVVSQLVWWESTGLGGLPPETPPSLSFLLPPSSHLSSPPPPSSNLWLSGTTTLSCWIINSPQTLKDKLLIHLYESLMFSSATTGHNQPTNQWLPQSNIDSRQIGFTQSSKPLMRWSRSKTSINLHRPIFDVW